MKPRIDCNFMVLFLMTINGTVLQSVSSFVATTRLGKCGGNNHHRWLNRGMKSALEKIRSGYPLQSFHRPSSSLLGMGRPHRYSVVASHPAPIRSLSFMQRQRNSHQPILREFHRSKATLGSGAHSDESSITRREEKCDTHGTSATVRHTMNAAIQELSEAQISEPLLSVVHLLATALQLPWDTGYRDLMDLLYQEDGTIPTRLGNVVDQRLSNRLLTTEEDHTFRLLLDRRLRHEPIQYLCGQWDFLDYTVSVRAPLLCPRPETEELVLLALEEIQEKHKDEPIRILDVGCGTGCIGIALAHKIPNAMVTAIDVEPVAVATSLENADRIGVLSRYEALMCSMEDFVLTKDDERYDMVISNPPYIPPDDMTGLQPDVLQYESHQALAGGGPDGMNIIRTIVQRLPLICKAGAICWMEVDPTQPAILRDWLSQATGTSSGSVQFLWSKTDMFGKERFVKLQVCETNESIPSNP